MHYSGATQLLIGCAWKTFYKLVERFLVSLYCGLPLCLSAVEQCQGLLTGMHDARSEFSALGIRIMDGYSLQFVRKRAVHANHEIYPGRVIVAVVVTLPAQKRHTRTKSQQRRASDLGHIGIMKGPSKHCQISCQNGSTGTNGGAAINNASQRL